MTSITRYNGVYYVVSGMFGVILETRDINEAYREYHYQKHTLANIDTNECEAITLSKEVYKDGRLIDSYDYEEVY